MAALPNLLELPTESLGLREAHHDDSRQGHVADHFILPLAVSEVLPAGADGGPRVGRDSRWR